MQNNCGRVKLNGTVGLLGWERKSSTLTASSPCVLSRSARFYIMLSAWNFIAILRFFAPQRSRELFTRRMLFQITRWGNNYCRKIIF